MRPIISPTSPFQPYIAAAMCGAVGLYLATFTVSTALKLFPVSGTEGQSRILIIAKIAARVLLLLGMAAWAGVSLYVAGFMLKMVTVGPLLPFHLQSAAMGGALLTKIFGAGIGAILVSGLAIVRLD